ncbi:MAG: TMEM43 family protein [Myxococcales bacterium]|nr:TMEM43 family protein [Myxococcota bacterium]MDW8280737.1 TMEM43 family protein [Myxococcales bacterium]
MVGPAAHRVPLGSAARAARQSLRRARRRRQQLLLATAAALGLAFGALLYVRFQPPDPLRLAQEARPASAEAVNPALEGQVVAVTGPLRAEGLLGDPGLLRPGGYIELWREVEIFAWHEDHIGPQGPRYELRWGPDPPATSEMKQPEGHENPPIVLRSEVLNVPRAWVGALRFDPVRARLRAQPLPLSPEMLEDQRHRLSDGYLYVGKGTAQAPQIGDARIRYHAVPTGQLVTLFGAQQGDKIVPAHDVRGTRLYHLLPGPYEEALRELPALLWQKPMLLR